MSDDFTKNNIDLSDEYAAIFASVYGNQDTVSSSENITDEPAATEGPVDWESLYDLPHNDEQDYPSDSYTCEKDEGYDSDPAQESSYPNSYVQYEESNSDSYSSSPSQYYEDDECEENYGAEYDEYDEYEDDNYDYDSDSDSFPSSFKDYITAKITGSLFRIRGSVPASSSSSTDSEDEFELGREVSEKYASKYYGSFLYSQKLRLRAGIIVLLFMAYSSLSLPVPGMLKNQSVMILYLLALQLTVMLICLDVFTTGLVNMFTGKFGADSLAALSCIVTTIDALSILYTSFSTMHMPFCILSSLSLYGVLLSSYLNTKALRKALRVPSIGKKIFTVTGEENVVGKDITLLKSTRPLSGFVRRIEEAPVDESTYRKASPVILILSIVLTSVIVFTKKNYASTLYVFSALLASSVPFTALLCYALPFNTGSKRIFSSGAAIAGWSGTTDLGHSKNLIVTDRDLFPESMIEIENVRIFADYDSDKIISYASSIINESESSLVVAFEKLMQENNCSYRHVDSFEVLQGGGFKGLIDGHVVICGNTDLMRLMDVRLPFRLVSPTTVLLSIDGILYGIFNIKYSADPDVRRALVTLMRSNRHPVFATRDFNVTPDMIREIFDVATDGYDFPPYMDRFPISKARPAEDSKTAAVVCREGLGPLTVMADTGRSIFVITRINLMLSLVSAFLSCIFVFLRLQFGTPLGVGTILLIYAVSTVPILVLGILTKAPN